MSIEIIKFDKKVFVLILRNGPNINDNTFFSGKDNPFQLGILKYKKGDKNRAHTYKPSKKVIYNTQEILYMQHGNR